MKQFFAVIALAFLVSNIGFSQQPVHPVRYIFDPTADAKSDLQSALSRASKEHKPVLALVGGDWSVACVEFDALMRHDDIKSFVQDNYVFLRINFSPGNKNEEVLKSIDCPKYVGYPVLMVLDEQGKKLVGKNCDEYKHGPRDPYSDSRILKSLASWLPKKG